MHILIFAIPAGLMILAAWNYVKALDEAFYSASHSSKMDVPHIQKCAIVGSENTKAIAHATSSAQLRRKALWYVIGAITSQIGGMVLAFVLL